MATLFELDKKFFEMFDLEQKPSGESDKECFIHAFENFLRSGRKEDAFVVYFCFCEIFDIFGEGYDNAKRLLELLSDHEYHSGELLAKHRDHYSHSIYVFALGLAIYANDNYFKKTFLNLYGLNDDKKAGLEFLRMWGCVSLFHDIGYPFQLAHEQIKAYADEVMKEGTNNVFVSFGNINNLIALPTANQKCLIRISESGFLLKDINDLLAYGLQFRMNYDFSLVSERLCKRITEQHEYVDHGYFSAVLLARQFLSSKKEFDIKCLDIITAILLHNSFNKIDAPGKRPIDIHEHPLAYLLVLCDELQCWDRLAYGKISKRDPIAWDVDFSVTDNRISAKYIYDSFNVKVYDDGHEICRINKNVDKMQYGRFANEIVQHDKDSGDKTAFLVSLLQIDVKCEEKKKIKKINNYASDDRFINLYDLAKMIHASYNEHCRSFSTSRINEDFNKLPLEFKISNIESAKSYSYKLELINCFYSGKDLDYPIVSDFKKIKVGKINNVCSFLCREEHIRWVKEKLSLGWNYGTDYKDADERNRKKIHKDLLPYDLLPETERSKDELMVNNILNLLPKFESNIKIYNYGTDIKPTFVIAGTGHRYFITDREVLKAKIKTFLSECQKEHRVIVRTCFAYGADQLIAECAVELDITIKASLPMDYEDYIVDVKNDALKNGINYSIDDELRMRHLLALTAVCDIVPDKQYKYGKANEHILKKCDMLLALWDREEIPLTDHDNKPINKGGTYDCIQTAEKQGKAIKIIDCFR